MKTEVERRQVEELFVRLDGSEVEAYVRRTLNLSEEWVLESYVDEELMFTRKENDTREKP